MDKLIYNQNKLPKGQRRYGFRTSAATGCGWIATYNALRIMGRAVRPEQVIRSYEKMLPVINGTVGTFLLDPILYFKKRGYGVEVRVRRSKFDQAAKNSDASILYYWWREKFRVGAHYVALHHRNGRFLGYNTFRNSKGPDDYGESLSGFLKKRKYFWPVLIAIRKKKSGK